MVIYTAFALLQLLLTCRKSCLDLIPDVLTPQSEFRTLKTRLD